VIELLAITDDHAPAPPPLRVVPAGRLGVVVGPAPAGDPDAEDLWRREAMLEELMAERALLPVRYGTRVADDAAAAAAVEPRGAELAAALERVRGAVELSVRAGDAALHERLAPLAREHVHREGPEALRTAYLVDRGAVDGFLARVEELRRERPELEIVCTGPWPPYSFAEAPHVASLPNLLSRRIDADPDSVQKGLAQLVLTIVELLRQLMERQALRRIDGGGLSDQQIEDLGRTFMALDEKMEELREVFGLEPEDLNLDLGPLGRLL
jgi:hypothetical protein